jgi:hypothetical protein
LKKANTNRPTEVKQTTRKDVFVRKVVMPKKVKVLPNAGLFFSAKVVKAVKDRVTCVVFQPDLCMDGLEIPAILNRNKGSILLHVLSTSGKTITIVKGTKLGSVTEEPNWGVSQKLQRWLRSTRLHQLPE